MEAEGSTRRRGSSQLFTAGTTPVLRTQGRGGYSRLQLAVRPPSRGATPAACARGEKISYSRSIKIIMKHEVKKSLILDQSK